MYAGTVVIALVGLAPLVSSHGGAPVPNIFGLNVKDLKTRDLFSNLRARVDEVNHPAVYEKRENVKARQADQRCGPDFGSCAEGVCCSATGCMASPCSF